jgi:hypothetical protein
VRHALVDQAGFLAPGHHVDREAENPLGFGQELGAVANARNLVMAGCKCGALSNGLSALVLAQIALLAVTQPGTDLSFYNAIGGMVFGGLDLVISLTMAVLWLRKKKAA